MFGQNRRYAKQADPVPTIATSGSGATTQITADLYGNPLDYKRLLAESSTTNDGSNTIGDWQIAFSSMVSELSTNARRQAESMRPEIESTIFASQSSSNKQKAYSDLLDKIASDGTTDAETNTTTIAGYKTAYNGNAALQLKAWPSPEPTTVGAIKTFLNDALTAERSTGSNYVTLGSTLSQKLSVIVQADNNNTLMSTNMFAAVMTLKKALVDNFRSGI
ncbi:hypothetical protein [Noviherbaspirillum galbum]|uniref:Uncharacterized protein n=1 Tax=Noviherbaspirillum galbum TaxID=2709383 RepID=A0A6B3STA8_9BURK|nr:hypothetical protein [Noviherbaspirillum galbum]NEX64210.1 hypothetical protein [Noviherbaspirillum galbum]